jgi:hypothetical protein
MKYKKFSKKSLNIRNKKIARSPVRKMFILYLLGIFKNISKLNKIINKIDNKESVFI